MLRWPHICRTRILLKSTEDVDYDLAYQIQVSPWNKQKDLAVQSSFSKLKRDFSRVHKAYRAALQQHHEKQKAEMALLSAQIEESTAPPATPTRRNKGSVLKKVCVSRLEHLCGQSWQVTCNFNEQEWSNTFQPPFCTATGRLLRSCHAGEARRNRKHQHQGPHSQSNLLGKEIHSATIQI